MYNKPLIKYSVFLSTHVLSSGPAKAQGVRFAANDPSSLFPSCAQPCVERDILQRFHPFVCSSPDDFACLCSSYLQSGSALQDIISKCYQARCTDERRSKKHTPSVNPCERLETAAAAQTHSPRRPHRTRTLGIAPSVTHRPRGESRTMSDDTSSDELPSEITPADTSSVSDDDDILVATDGPPVSTTAADASPTESTADSTITSASATNTPEASTRTPEPTVKALSPGQVAGISIGGVATALIVFFVLGTIYACVRRRKERARKSAQAWPKSPSPRFGGLEKDHHGGDFSQTMANGRELPRLSAAYPKIVDPDKIGVAIGSPGQPRPSPVNHNRSGSTTMLIQKAHSTTNFSNAPKSMQGRPLDQEGRARCDSDVTIINDQEDQPIEHSRDIPNPPPSRPPRPSFHIIPATPTQLPTAPPPAAMAIPPQAGAGLYTAVQQPLPTTRQKPSLTPLKLSRNNKTPRNRESAQSTHTLINEEPQTAALPPNNPRQSTDTIMNEEPQTAGLDGSHFRQSANAIINRGTQTASIPRNSSRHSTATIINEEPQSAGLPLPMPMVTVSESAAGSRNGYTPGSYTQAMPPQASYIPSPSTLKSLPPPTYTSYRGVTTAAPPAAPPSAAPTKPTRSNTATSTTSTATTIDPSPPSSRNNSLHASTTPPKESNRALTPVLESPNPRTQTTAPRHPGPIPSARHTRSTSSGSTSSTLAEKRQGPDVPGNLKKGLWVTGSHGKTMAPIDGRQNYAPAPAPTYTNNTAPAPAPGYTTPAIATRKPHPPPLGPAPVAWSTTVPMSNYNAQKHEWPARSSSRRANSRGERLGRQVVGSYRGRLVSPRMGGGSRDEK